MPQAAPLQLTPRFERALALLAATSLNAAICLTALDPEVEVGRRYLPTDAGVRQATRHRVSAPPPATPPADDEFDPWLRRPGFGSTHHG